MEFTFFSKKPATYTLSARLFWPWEENSEIFKWRAIFRNVPFDDWFPVSDESMETYSSWKRFFLVTLAPLCEGNVKDSFVYETSKIVYFDNEGDLAKVRLMFHDFLIEYHSYDEAKAAIALNEQMWLEENATRLKKV